MGESNSSDRRESQNKDSKKRAQMVTPLKSCPSSTVPIQASANSVTLTETQSLSTVFISSTVQPLTKILKKSENSMVFKLFCSPYLVLRFQCAYESSRVCPLRF